MKRIAAGLAILAVLWLGAGAAIVIRGEPKLLYARADAAVVLGAAIRADGSPSPVYEGRLEHGLALLQGGMVRKLVLTGGRGPGLPRSEASAGRQWAIARGADPDAILIEEVSRTTQQNLAAARPLLRRAGLRSILLVSDPLHLPRALRMARDLGIDARASPTNFSRYRSPRTRLPFLLRESFFMPLYLLVGV